MSVFFFNDTATTEIYTLSLHDALPICQPPPLCQVSGIARLAGVAGHTPKPHLARLAGEHCGSPSPGRAPPRSRPRPGPPRDRKSTRLNSSHANISYAVFCLKKKKKNIS